MQSIQQWITLLAMLASASFASGFLVQLIKRPHWRSWVKQVLAGVVALVVTLAALWLAGSVQPILALWGHLSADDVWRFGVLVFTGAALWYHTYFSKVGWAQALGNLGAKAPPKS